jgi:hypothetical protein
MGGARRMGGDRQPGVRIRPPRVAGADSESRTAGRAGFGSVRPGGPGLGGAVWVVLGTGCQGGSNGKGMLCDKRALRQNEKSARHQTGISFLQGNAGLTPPKARGRHQKG